MRAIQKSDIDVLSTLYAKAYSSRSEEKWSIDTIQQLLIFLLIKQPELCLVMEKEQQIIGAVFGSIKPWWNGNHLILEEIFVDPDIHGKGVGSSLLNEVCKKAQELHAATYVEAMTFRDADFPKNWYFTHAFEEIKEWIPLEGTIENVIKTLS